MLIDFQWATGRYIPEDTTLHSHRCKSLKSYVRLLIENKNPKGYMMLESLKAVYLIILVNLDVFFINS
jgi:hypothetical protein